MKNTLRAIFRTGKFTVGFAIFAVILLFVIVYPLFVRDDPLLIIGQGTFFPPGVYVSTLDAINARNSFTLNLEDAAARRIAGTLGEEERAAMEEWLIMAGVPAAAAGTEQTDELLRLWERYFSPDRQLPGLTFARHRYFQRLDADLEKLRTTDSVVVTVREDETEALREIGSVTGSDYVNVNQIANVRVLPLGTDNFGRDVLTELVRATGVSLQIGLVAGTIATLIGLVLGLLAGYVGGILDDLIMFITNLFTVIPSFVLLILISFSIGQEQRGAFTIAAVIGLTSWVWTARAVRSQVFSLRNRDHVNISKISGHSIGYIIVADILPYVASYVVMAFILQISAAILAEAGLSILGLGPRTTDVPTLGLMMNWAMIYQAHILGKWWAYFPVIAVIALTSFSLNLMNTGLDQVFNPALRD